jgi:hypothetical protein
MYKFGADATWSGKGLYRFKRLPRKAALATGIASKQKRYWWKPAATVPEPDLCRASSAAAYELSQRWIRFAIDFRALREAISSAATTPEGGG